MNRQSPQGPPPSSPPPVSAHGDAFRISVSAAGTLLGVGVIVLILAVMLYTSWTPPPAVPGRKTDAQRQSLLASHQAADQQELSTYGWTDQGKGIVRIPISLAMEKLIEESARPTTAPLTAGPAAAATAPAKGEAR